MLFYYDLIKKYDESLAAGIDRYEKLLALFPEGALKIWNRKDGGTVFYVRYSCDGKRITKHLNKTNDDLRKYVNKRFAVDALRVMKRNQKACEAFLKHHSGTEAEIIAQSYSEEFQIINSNLIMTRICKEKKWLNEAYPTNPFNKEAAVHDTKKGVYVRSKSEAMISNALYDRGIPYRNECILRLRDNGPEIYPDFTILKPDHSGVIYWEHFGMLGKEDYSSDACKKIKRYINSGIFPGIQLIVTMESETVPLSSVMIEQIIDKYFSQ